MSVGFWSEFKPIESVKFLHDDSIGTSGLSGEVRLRSIRIGRGVCRVRLHCARRQHLLVLVELSLFAAEDLVFLLRWINVVNFSFILYRRDRTDGQLLNLLLLLGTGNCLRNKSSLRK